MAYQIKWTPEAEKSFDSIVEYLFENFSEKAESLAFICLATAGSTTSAPAPFLEKLFGLTVVLSQGLTKKPLVSGLK